MPTTYVECPDCGKRALSVATRCPHCGSHFPPRPITRPAPPSSFGASRGMIAVGGAVLTLIVVALLVRHGRGGAERMSPAPSPSADSTPAAGSPAPAGAPSPIANGSARAKEGTQAATVGGARAAPAAPAPAAPASGPAPSPSADRPGVRRYAQTWVNVRGDRTRSAPTVGMLNPGDAVTVDSLVRGWYRVVVDGRALGYVHRSTLDVSRPE